VAAERTLTRRATWAERVEPLTRNPGRTAAVALGVMVLVAVAARLWLSREIVSPWIMIDELIYSEMAKSFASSGHFLIRDGPSGVISAAYPALISPAWWFHPMSTTYGVAKVVNVVLMTLAAVPLYLWARRLVSPLHGVVAVALTLLLPSFVYTGMLMSENAFLPAFVLAAFAFAAALERPTVLRQGLAFGAILLASFVRLQGLVLVAVLPTAILLKVLFELRAAPRRSQLRFVWTELRRYWFSGALLAAGAVFYALREVASGRSLSSGLGSYQEVARGGYSFGEARHWVLLHVAELPLSVGVLPACALLLLLILALRHDGTRNEAERAFLAVSAASVAWIVVEVAVFASRFSFRVEERYMFFLAPLLFLAFAIWLDRGLPRPPIASLIAAVVPAALLFMLPLGTLLNVSIYSDTFGLIPFLRLAEKFPGGVAEARHFLLVGGIAAALAFLLWPREAYARLVLPAAVAGFLVLSTYPVIGVLRDYSTSLGDTAGTLGSRSWVDNRIGSGGDAAFLLGTTPEPAVERQVLWQTEFWNRSLRTVYNLSDQGLSHFTETPVHAIGNGLFLNAVSAKLAPRYIVANLSFELDGQLIAARPPLALYRTSGPLRLAAARGGIYGDGWMGSYGSYNRYSPRSPRGTVAVTLSRAAWTGPDVPGHVRIVRISDGGRRLISRWTIHSGASRTFTVPVSRGPFGIAVYISPTFSPSTFGQPDTRQLGAQITFRYRPAST
jgi:hypothetical protein